MQKRCHERFSHLNDLSQRHLFASVMQQHCHVRFCHTNELSPLHVLASVMQKCCHVRFSRTSYHSRVVTCVFVIQMSFPRGISSHLSCSSVATCVSVFFPNRMNTKIVVMTRGRRGLFYLKPGARVTRLGEFSPIRRLFNVGSIWKLTSEKALSFWLHTFVHGLR
jgi:hypothetical protein